MSAVLNICRPLKLTVGGLSKCMIHIRILLRRCQSNLPINRKQQERLEICSVDFTAFCIAMCVMLSLVGIVHTLKADYGWRPAAQEPATARNPGLQ